jgi:mono/diheme cytochrome c family protein
MRRVLRWLVALLVAAILLAALAAGVVYALSELRLQRRFAVAVPPITIPTDPASIERGRHFATALAKCADCHGENMAGQVFIDAPPFHLVGSNLTRGQGGVGAAYRDEDWVRAIRFGVRPDGRPLAGMPSEEYVHLSERDLADIIAFVKSVPPADNVLPASRFRPLGRALFVAGVIPPLAAEIVDRGAPFPSPVAEGVTVEYGRYLALTGGCLSCHGPGLSGGPVPGVPPDFPPAANVTPAGAIGQWSEADFFTALREGKKPGGADINPFMPWKATAKMTDDEVRALWLFLRSVPPKPYGNR